MYNGTPRGVRGIVNDLHGTTFLSVADNGSAREGADIVIPDLDESSDSFGIFFELSTAVSSRDPHDIARWRYLRFSSLSKPKESELLSFPVPLLTSFILSISFSSLPADLSDSIEGSRINCARIALLNSSLDTSTLLHSASAVASSHSTKFHISFNPSIASFGSSFTFFSSAASIKTSLSSCHPPSIGKVVASTLPSFPSNFSTCIILSLSSIFMRLHCKQPDTSLAIWHLTLRSASTLARF
mmetsp:Transcript_26658/g.38212  ORF Transcript_26658/g.38212 Transcript_26658/m.38212 type:complete len:242 (-) Transcript_26658:36-761(-)